jgi:hypothetical protein
MTHQLTKRLGGEFPETFFRFFLGVSAEIEAFFWENCDL